MIKIFKNREKKFFLTYLSTCKICIYFVCPQFGEYMKIFLSIFLLAFSYGADFERNSEETLENFRFPINLENMRNPVEQDPCIIRERFFSYIKVYADHLRYSGISAEALYGKIMSDLFPKDIRSIERLGPFETVETFSDKTFYYFGVSKIRDFFMYTYLHG